jgi:phage tail-like protein
MAGGDAQETSVWPLPSFSFRLEMDGQTAAFQEVSGLGEETQVIEYRGGDAGGFAHLKLPGVKKYGNVTLKRGVIGSAVFKDMFGSFPVSLGAAIKTSEMRISLLDQSGEPLMVWTLKNAYPVKMTTTDFKADGDEVLVEVLELACEGVTVVKPE